MTFSMALRRWLTTACFCLGATFFLFLPAAGTVANDGRAQGPLDGMSFVGTLGPLENRDIDDVLYFENGRFWSQSCASLGFTTAPYWTRMIGKTVEFRGFLESPDHGRFSFLGRVADGRATVDIDWRRERWYWSIERKIRFEGTLSQKPSR